MTNDPNFIEAISDSGEETIVSKNKFNELVLTLEGELKKLQKENEEDALNKKIGDTSGDEESEEEFLDDHLKELKKLKKISIQPHIGIRDITWFLNTAIFGLMNQIPDEFSFKSLALYECMIERIESFSKNNDFFKHKQLLLDLKNEENDNLLMSLKKKKEKGSKSYALLVEKNEREKQVPVRFLFLALDARKRALKEGDAESNPAPAKRIKLPRISPLALPNNNLSIHINECHENSLRPGMKLT